MGSSRGRRRGVNSDSGVHYYSSFWRGSAATVRTFEAGLGNFAHHMLGALQMVEAVQLREASPVLALVLLG